VVDAELVALSSDRQQRLPRIGVMRWNLEYQMIVDIDETGAPLRSFEIARRPEQLASDAAEH
jgi:hypothetical protein